MTTPKKQVTRLIFGGMLGAADGHPVLNSIRIVVKPNTNNIVTVFPM